MESFVFLFVCATIMTSTQVKAEKTKLRVGALMSIFNDPNDLSASNLNIESVKNLEAILWVFRQLNDINYIDGFEIGKYKVIQISKFKNCFRKILNCYYGI